MSRTTNANLDGMFRRLVGLAYVAGLDAFDWKLHGGSSSSGIDYKLETTRGHFILLGRTKTQAWDAMGNMCEAFQLVLREK